MVFPVRRKADGSPMTPTRPEINSIAGCPIKRAEVRKLLRTWKSSHLSGESFSATGMEPLDTESQRHDSIRGPCVRQKSALSPSLLVPIAFVPIAFTVPIAFSPHRLLNSRNFSNNSKALAGPLRLLLIVWQNGNPIQQPAELPS